MKKFRLRVVSLQSRCKKGFRVVLDTAVQAFAYDTPYHHLKLLLVSWFQDRHRAVCMLKVCVYSYVNLEAEFSQLIPNNLLTVNVVECSKKHWSIKFGHCIMQNHTSRDTFHEHLLGQSWVKDPGCSCQEVV